VLIFVTSAQAVLVLNKRHQYKSDTENVIKFQGSPIYPFKVIDPYMSKVHQLTPSALLMLKNNKLEACCS